MKLDLSFYNGLKDKDLSKSNILIGEGRTVVERMLTSGIKVLSVLCTDTLGDYFKKTCNNICPVILQTHKQMSELVGFPFHRGVIAAGQRPEQVNLKALFNSTYELSSCVILPDVSEAENLGVIIRSAFALGIDHILLGSGCCDPFSRKVIRCSMGNVFFMHPIKYTCEQVVSNMLRSNDYKIIGAHLIEEAKPVYNYAFPPKVAIILGNEFYGLKDIWLNICDDYVKIPIEKNADSLNLGVSAGILFYELSKRIKLI